MLEVVAAVIINNQGKVFIAQRSSPEYIAGLWEFPGGKIEKGESPQESLVRELDEEFGMSVEVLDFFTESSYKYDSGSVNISSYLVRLIDEKYEVREHNDAKWIGIEEFDDYPMAPADVKIVSKLEKKPSDSNI